MDSNFFDQTKLVFMRSFVALMACIGCIAWVHSCDKRLLGVKINSSSDRDLQLPVDVPSIADHQPVVIPIPVYTAAVKVTAPATRVNPATGRFIKRSRNITIVTDSLLNEMAITKRPGLLMNTLTP